MTFPAFGSIPRLHRHFTITEKIDGTNGAIYIDEASFDGYNEYGLTLDHDLGPVPGIAAVAAGSRNRWLTDTKGDDNHGFAAWVRANASTLITDLRPGLHYGEWWGSGIARGYGLPKGEKRFSLFNTKRWSDNGRTKPTFSTPGLSVVPVLFDSETFVNDPDEIATYGEYGEGLSLERVTLTRLSTMVDASLLVLREMGSKVSPGFMRPEGIIVYHSAAGQYFKVTLEKDDIPKTVAKQREKQPA